MARNEGLVDDGVVRYHVTYPKHVRDWNTGQESIRWQRIGQAKEAKDGRINIMINSQPLQPWDGTLMLERIGDREDSPN